MIGVRQLRTTEHIIVTTGDIQEDYTIIGPVHYQVCTGSFFLSDPFSDLVNQYRKELPSSDDAKARTVHDQRDWGPVYGQHTLKGRDSDAAFYIAVEELKKRALLLDADAIIHMRQDIDLRSDGAYYFYLQMYGTAVRLKERPERITVEPEPKPAVAKDVSGMCTCPICGSKNMRRRSVCLKCGHPLAEGSR